MQSLGAEPVSTQHSQSRMQIALEDQTIKDQSETAHKTIAWSLQILSTVKVHVA